MGCDKRLRWPQALLALGGILESENCIKAHIAASRACGAELICNRKVRSWEAAADGGLVTVRDSTGTQHTAKQVVLCVGAWSSQLVPELQGYLQPERQVVAWFEVLPSCFWSPGTVLVYNSCVTCPDTYGT